jgi:hypothetical protein
MTKVTIFERMLANTPALLYDIEMKGKFHKSGI